MNEAGASEAMQFAIFGSSSRKMIERYSHIRTEARREAMNARTFKAPNGLKRSGTRLSPKESAQRRIM
jgi:hypothetical protein